MWTSRINFDAKASLCSQTMLIELMVHEISLSNRANLSHSELTEMHFTSYGMNEHKTWTDLCFEVKKIKFALEFPHIIRRKKSFAAHKIWLILLTFMKNGSREPSPNNRETWIIEVQLHKPKPKLKHLAYANFGMNEKCYYSGIRRIKCKLYWWLCQTSLLCKWQLFSSSITAMINGGSKQHE